MPCNIPLTVVTVRRWHRLNVVVVVIHRLFSVHWFRGWHVLASVTGPLSVCCLIVLLVWWRVQHLAVSPALSVVENEVDGVDYAWNMPEDSEQNVYQEVGITASLEEYGDGWEEDGDNDFADFCSASHDDGIVNRCDGSVL